jgi:hypothetical protein
MPIALKIKDEGKGMESFQAAMKMMEKLGSRAYGAQLMDTGRQDGGEPNTEILEFLSKGGRDMFSFGQDKGKVLQWIADDITKRVDFVLKKKGKVESGRATAIMSNVLRKGLRRHIDKNVLKNIDTNTNADGSPAKAVDPEYSGTRAARFGIPDDPTQVGVASGQLIEALARGIIQATSGK